ncbi:hypothetical protein EJB05_17528 [Eragrostis curvula]|uniref:Uncharacterized protein n=1 Tax=Eragrostis curvula TaxID=38414 RepID=A0A5J9VIQ6_9POAL|nr:hypothetical protein EJB05_17528 [Eragrostis curvula]
MTGRLLASRALQVFIAEQEQETQTPRSAKMSRHTSAAASVSSHGQMSRQMCQALDELEADPGNQRDSKVA